MLPCEVRALPHLEVALLAAEPPEHLLRLAIDLVDRVRVASRHEEVPVRLDGDRIDVEVVVRRGFCTGLCGRRRGVGLPDCNLRVAVPFEEDALALDVDLLDDSVPDRPLFRASYGREIDRQAVVDGEHRGVSLRDQKLVDVADEAVAGADLRHGPVRGVVDDVPAVSDAHIRDVTPPPRQHRLAEIVLDAEVRDAAGVQRLEPDDLAAVVHDHRACLRDDHLRGEEDVAGRGVVGQGCGSAPAAASGQAGT